MSLHLSCILLIYLIVGAKKYANINTQTNVSSIPLSTFSKNTQMFLDKMLKSIPKAEMPFPYHLHHHSVTVIPPIPENRHFTKTCFAYFIIV